MPPPRQGYEPPADYNPHSPDAMFSRIMLRLEQQDRSFAEHRVELKATMEEVRSTMRQSQGRIGNLEVWRTEMRAKAVVIAGLVSAFVAAVWQWWLNRSAGH
jgi:hypothetical protein